MLDSQQYRNFIEASHTVGSPLSVMKEHVSDMAANLKVLVNPASTKAVLSFCYDDVIMQGLWLNAADDKKCKGNTLNAPVINPETGKLEMGEAPGGFFYGRKKDGSLSVFKMLVYTLFKMSNNERYNGGNKTTDQHTEIIPGETYGRLSDVLAPKAIIVDEDDTIRKTYGCEWAKLPNEPAVIEAFKSINSKFETTGELDLVAAIKLYHDLNPDIRIWVDVRDVEAAGDNAFDVIDDMDYVDIHYPNLMVSGYMDSWTCWQLCNLLSDIIGKDKHLKDHKLIRVSEIVEGHFSMVVDGATRYQITPSNVFRGEAEVQCMSLNEGVLLNPHAALIWTIASHLHLGKGMKKSGNMFPAGRWERRYVQQMLPLEMEVLSGTETHGMRLHYNKYVSQNFSQLSKIFVPTGSEEKGYGAKFTYEANKKRANIERLKSHEGAARMLAKFNLFFSDKSGVYMDNRLLGLRLRDVPKSGRAHLVHTCLERLGNGDSKKGVELAFGKELRGADPQEVSEFVAEQLVILESTKTTKPVPRIQLRHPTASNYLVDGVESAFVESVLVLEHHRKVERTSVKTGDDFVNLFNATFKRDIVHREAVVLAESITDTAGLSIRWKPMKDFFVAKNVTDILHQHNFGKGEAAIDLLRLKVGDGLYNKFVKPNGVTRYEFTNPTGYAVELSIGGHRLITDYAGYDSDGKFCKQQVCGSQVKKGTLLLEVPYTLANGKEGVHEVRAPRDMFIYAFEYIHNDMGSVEVKFFGLYLSSNYKMRNTLKAMPAFSVTGRKYYNNSLNSHIPEGAAMLITQDCIKYKDVLKGDLTYVAATAHENGFDHMLEEVNARIGFPEIKGGLVYDKLPASHGMYEHLSKWFWNRYGQPVWVYRRDIANGAWSVVEKGLQQRHAARMKGKKDGDTSWQWITLAALEAECPEVKGKFPADSRVYITVTDDSCITDYHDIMVFYTDDHPECPLACWQRGYAATSIVNEEGNVEHVYGEHKAELSDFEANCTDAKTMGGVVTNVSMDNGTYTGCPEYAMRLIADHKERVDKYAAFAFMAKTEVEEDGDLDDRIVLGRDGEEEAFPVLDVYEGDEVSDEFLERVEHLVGHAENRTLNVKMLRDAFRDEVLCVGSLLLYLPVIAAQDAIGSNADSVSGIIRDLFRVVICGAELDEVKGMISRLRSAIATTVGINSYTKEEDSEGLNILRNFSQGRTSVLSKLVAVNGLPHADVVPISDDPNSICQVYVKLFSKLGYTDKELYAPGLWDEYVDGDARVLIHRTPLSSNAPRPVKFVNVGDYVYRFEDEDVCEDLYYLITNYVTPEDSSECASVINDKLKYTNSIDILIQMGDCDGDGENSTPIDKDITADYIPNLDLDTCLNSVLQATSLPAFSYKQSGYTMDQMVPVARGRDRYENPTALSKKNFKCLDGKLAKDREGNLFFEKYQQDWKGTSKGGGDMKRKHVPAAYQLSNITNNTISISRACAEIMGLDTEDDSKDNLIYMAQYLGLKTYMLNPALIKPFAEVYEAGTLSGLNWDGMFFMGKVLTPAMRHQGKIDVPGYGYRKGDKEEGKEFGTYDKYVAALEAAGVNANYAREYYYHARNIGNLKYDFNDAISPSDSVGSFEETLDFANDRNIGTLKRWIEIAANLAFWLSRGQLHPSQRMGKLKVWNYMVAYMECHAVDEEYREELGEICPAIKLLNYAVPKMLMAGSFPDRELKDAVLEHFFGLTEEDIVYEMAADSFRN